MNNIKNFISALIGAFFSFFGLLAIPILLLVGANVTDYVTGLVASSNRKEKISSYKSFKGIIKKIMHYVLILVSAMIDALIKYSVVNLGFSFEWPMLIACVTTVWLVANEFISILENLVDIGVPIPKFLMPIVKKLKNYAESIYDTNKEE